MSTSETASKMKPFFLEHALIRPRTSVDVFALVLLDELPKVFASASVRSYFVSNKIERFYSQARFNFNIFLCKGHNASSTCRD